MKSPIPAFVLLLSLAAAAHAADNAFVGAWKSDPAKSNANGGERVFTKTAHGYRVTGGIATIDFSDDGREHPTPDGFLEAWKPVDDFTWESRTTLAGKVTQTGRHVLSSDGGTLVQTYTFLNSDGTSTVTEVTRTRLSGKTGLVGRWRTVKVDFTPEVTTITVPAAGTLRIATPSREEIIEGPTDGSPFAMTGPGIPAGWFATLKQTGARTLRWSGGLDGKPMIRGTFAVSADGRTLTNTYSFVTKPSARSIEVSERQ